YVRAAVTPPLRVAAADEGHVRPVRRGRGRPLVRVAVGGDLQGRPAVGAHAVDVVARGDVARRRGEVDPTPVVRPRVELLEAVVEGESPEVARGEVEHVDVAVARARRDEGEAAAVGRVERARLGRRVRDEQAGLAALRGHSPDVAAGDEGDLLA